MRIRTRRWVLLTALPVLLFAAGCPRNEPSPPPSPPATSASATPTVEPTPSPSTSTPVLAEEVATPLLATALTVPVPVKGTDGQIHLAYELSLTNILPTVGTIQSVQVIDDSGGTVLQDLSGPALAASFRAFGAPPADAATAPALGAGQQGIVWLDATIAETATPPTGVRHRIRVTYPQVPSALFTADTTETVAVTRVSDIPAPRIASPLDGTNWLDADGCCAPMSAHRGAANPINGAIHVAERFAIDFVRLDDQRRMLTGAATALSSYPYYGASVHAVADGEVVAVKDDLPDQPPGANPPEGSLKVSEYGGNYVVQKFTRDGKDYYAYYAHLAPGSAKERVRVGQTLRTGAVIGLLGNSGNTSAPHLHFHVMDGPNPLASDGLPFVFDRFELTGRAASPETIDQIAKAPTPLTTANGTTVGERQAEMPLFLDVLTLTAKTP